MRNNHLVRALTMILLMGFANFAISAVPISVKLYEGLERKALSIDGKDGVIVKKKQEQSSVTVTLINKSDNIRFLGVNIVVDPEMDGKTLFWDGLNEPHAVGVEAITRDKLVDTFPMSCVWNEKKGVALGFAADTLYSWLETSVGGEEVDRGQLAGGRGQSPVISDQLSVISKTVLSYGTRVVLKPGKRVVLRFTAFEFDPRWGWKSALDKYYKLFSKSFHPDPNIDPRLVNGIDASHNAYNQWHHYPYPEIFRRCHIRYGWCYAPFKRSGDFYCREKWWNWDTGSDEITRKYNAWVNNKKTAAEWRKYRETNFNNGEKANVANIFYISNCVESKLLKKEFPDAMIKPRTNFQWIYHEESPRVFTAGGKFGAHFKNDLKQIAAETDIAGFAWDSSGGMGSRKYRGKNMWDMPVVAFDDEGAFVYEGVGIADAINYMHKSIPVYGGKYKAGCKINPGGEHPMPYMMMFAGDNNMVEWAFINPTDDAVDFNLNKYIRLVGQKPIVLHHNLRADKYGEKINWREYPPEQIELFYRSVWEYNIIAYLKYGILPYPQQVLGVPKMFRIYEMLLDLVCTRGRYAVPGATAPEGIQVSRYGQGLRSVVCFGNIKTTPVSGKAILVGDDFCNGAAPLAADYTGEKMTFEIAGKESAADISLKQRRWLSLELIAAYLGDDAFSAKTQLTKTRHQITATVRSGSEAVSGAWRFPLIEGYQPPTIVLDGQNIQTSTGADFVECKMELSGEVILSAIYRSATYLTPDTDIADFEFVKDGKPNCTIVMPANADEEIQRAAGWIREYFRFWFKEKRQQVVELPIIELGEQSPLTNRVVLEIGRPRSLRRNGNVITITAPDASDMNQWVWDLLGVLDDKYPYYGGWHAAYDKWIKDPPFDYKAKTKQMLKETGMWGKQLKLYEGPELKDIKKRSPEELNEIYGLGEKAEAVDPGNEPFDAMDGLKCNSEYGTAKANAEVEMMNSKDGNGSVRMTWTAKTDRAGGANLTKELANPINITGRQFELWIMPLSADCGYWSLDFKDSNGAIVERHRIFTLKPNKWNKVSFAQGKKMPWGCWFEKGTGDATQVKTMVFSAKTHKAGQQGDALWDEFSIK